MAGFSSQIEKTPVWGSIQNLLKEYVSSLEAQRFQELEKLVKDAEVATLSLDTVTSEITKKQKEIIILEEKKGSIEQEILTLLENETSKKEEIKIVLEQIKLESEKFELLKNEITDAQKNNDEAKNEKNRLTSSLKEIDNNFAKISQKTTEKQKEMDDLLKKEKNLLDNITSLENKYLALETDTKKKEQESNDIANNIIKLQKEKEQAGEDLATEQNILIEFKNNKATEIQQVEKELDAIKEIILKERTDFEIEKEAVEKEKVFTKKFSEILDEKNKTITHIKKQFIDLVAKVSTYATDKTEIKNILYLIEKL